MQKITPFLWCDGNAEQAAKFYTSIFKNSKVIAKTYYPSGAAKATGRQKNSVMTVAFQIAGQRFVALNGGPQYKFTEAISFVVSCKTQKELDSMWKKLSAGGEEGPCGWLKDKFGVSWQVVPDNLDKLLNAKYPERVARVMEAVMQMGKLDIATLNRAYKG